GEDLHLLTVVVVVRRVHRAGTDTDTSRQQKQCPNHGRSSSKSCVSPPAMQVGDEDDAPARFDRVSARIPPHTLPGTGGVDKQMHTMAVAALIFGALAMNEEPTTVIIQRYLDALPGGAAAERIVRELLERAAGRLRLLCGTLLHKSTRG